jgi:chorismate synthase
MNGNTFGTLFKITTWGESHGPALGCVIDGCPAGIALLEQDFVAQMTARQGGKSHFTTARKESDAVHIESGVFEGKTTGTPIALRILNQNTRSEDYVDFQHTPRPGHADYTITAKQGLRDWRGGGRLSARETAARVAAGVVARKILQHFHIRTMAFVSRVGAREVPGFSFAEASTDTILGEWWPQVEALREQNSLRIPMEGSELADFLGHVEGAKATQDSLGGSIDCWVNGLPAGLGEPIFDKAQALLGMALLSLPAAVGFEAGTGIALSAQPGSLIRDPIGKEGPTGNRHGGLLGGITTGNPLRIRVHFHAPTSVAQPIESYNFKTQESDTIEVHGRHDSFPLPRAIPAIEAMVQITLVDLLARQGLLPASY